MTDQQWRQAWDLYQSASTLPPEQRDAYIDSTTDDIEVRCEVRTMISESAEGLPLQAGPISDAVSSAAAEVLRGKDQSFREGESFGRYRILKAIGRGGMGEVYEASDPELDRHVALKFLPAGSLDQPAAMARFNQEARSLSAINHPNIVTVHEVIQQSGQIAIVMELVEGQPLRQLCGPGPMQLQRLAHIGLQIARALEAAHSRGVIHGDIKPENVMVRPDGYAKVLDFGLARRAGEQVPETAQVIGTLRYMAPEQLSNEGIASASDVYSLGLVLYEMASGRHPFGGTTAFAELRSAAPKIPPPLHAQFPELPTSLDALVLAMLRQNPNERITAAQAVAQLEELARKADPRHVKESSLNRLGLAAIVCGSLAVIAGTVWWGVYRASPQTQALQIRPLTSQMGRESEPVVSPDGNWIAYLWAAGENDKSPGLYVKGVQEDTPRLLKTGDSPHAIRALAFSPDGSRIAFRRQDGIFAIPRAGTRAATELAPSEDQCQGTGLDWSPDGKSLLLAECPAASRIPRVVEVDLATGRRRVVTNPPSSTQGDFEPRYSPDGRRIAFRRAAQPVVEDLFVLDLASNGEPTAISRDARGIAGLAWMPDSKSLLVSSQRSGGIYSLWRFHLDKPFDPVALTQAGQHAKAPSVARKGGRAVWTSEVIDHNIWEIPFAGSAAPKRIIASLQRDLDGNIGPDGRIAFRSDRSGVSEIWIAAPDGSSPVRATSMDGPLTGTPRWSPDGKYLAFDSRPSSNSDIYLLRCDGAGCAGPPRRLTDDPAADFMPSWSKDGRSLYFASSRSGKREIWKLSIDAGAKPEQVTRNGGFLGMESEDGRWLYFSKIVEQHGIWRLPLQGGAEEFVAELFDDYGAGSWLLAPGGNEIVYLGSGKNSGVQAWNLVTGKGRILLQSGDRPIERGLSISRDGRRLIYSQLDRSDSNVMVAEGLR